MDIYWFLGFRFLGRLRCDNVVVYFLMQIFFYRYNDDDKESDVADGQRDLISVRLRYGMSRLWALAFTMCSLMEARNLVQSRSHSANNFDEIKKMMKRCYFRIWLNLCDYDHHFRRINISWINLNEIIYSTEGFGCYLAFVNAWYLEINGSIILKK